jgi:hypothetical protein
MKVTISRTQRVQTQNLHPPPLEPASEAPRLHWWTAAVLGSFLIAAPVPLANAALPVQWPVAAGGNGHYYEAGCVPQGISWTAASNAAVLAGGYLATIASRAENQFVFSLVDDAKFWHQLPDPNNHGPWLGGYQLPGAQEPAGGWVWVTGEAFTFTNWFAGTHEPTGGPWLGQNEDRLQYSSDRGTRAPTWNDIPNILPAQYAVFGYIVEYNSPPPECPKILSFSITNSETVHLQWQRVGVSPSYVVEAIPSLSQTNWQPVAPTNQWPVSTNVWRGTFAASTNQGFFRVKAVWTY